MADRATRAYRKLLEGETGSDSKTYGSELKKQVRKTRNANARSGRYVRKAARTGRAPA